MTYVEKYASDKGITVEEAMQHALIKEYLKDHPNEEAEETKAFETNIVFGCGCGCDS